jgi:NAD(P)-dependent dehydrogenase (short-subunit alcohol dehydrogenase family)
MSLLPEPIRMMAENPRLFDMTSDGPIAYVLRQKFTGFPAIPKGLSLTGKTVLVTGATSGVGYEAARQFVQLGANLIIGARNSARAEIVKQQYLTEAPHASIIIYELDMESLDSVDKFIDNLNAGGIRLNIAVLNAGLFSRNRRPVGEGWSHLMQVNFRCTAYLALRILPILLPTTNRILPAGFSVQPSRLILISSEAHAWTTYMPPNQGDVLPEFQHIDGASGRPDYEYYTSKLFVALFGRELATRLDPKKLEVVITSPGFCASGFFSDAESISTKLIFLTSARSLHQGGRLYIHAASFSNPEISGKFIRDGRITKSVLLISELSLFSQPQTPSRSHKSLTLWVPDYLILQNQMRVDFCRFAFGMK